jgi:hypothetical protein
MCRKTVAKLLIKELKNFKSYNNIGISKGTLLYRVHWELNSGLLEEVVW